MKNKRLPIKTGIEAAAQGASRAPRTTFTDEFKRNAVAKLREPGTNATLLALELGIRRNQLYKWAKTLDELAPGDTLKSPGRPPVADESEVVRLRRELARAEQELAILKKFDAYLTRLKK
jgi:transposase